MFDRPYVDVDELRDQPVRHRYMHGGFEGTDTRFSFYFPPKEQYQGRFFQHITPVPISENLAQGASGPEDWIGFSIISGAYFVESNGGGMSAMPPAFPPEVTGYQANAAVAQTSRVMAEQVYGPHRPYGYAFGGSGGSYRTVGGFENTKGVWDGVVPYVMPCPVAIPNVFSVGLLAKRILWEKFSAILDAVEPGGSGDPYRGLTEEECDVLREVMRMGFDPRAWFNYKTEGIGALAILFDGIFAMDPGYFQDFWTIPGYEGANPPESLRSARVQHQTTVKRSVSLAEAIQLGWEVAPKPAFEAPRGDVDTAWQVLQSKPVGFELEAPPVVHGSAAGKMEGAKLIVKSGTAAGQVLPIRLMEGTKVMIGASMSLGGEVSPAVKEIQAGDEVQVDNSDYLAFQYYHRHQVPTPDYSVWDQFRRADGTPIHPQRPMLLGPTFAALAGCSAQTGRFEGRMILLQSLLDLGALPWMADWYRSNVQNHFGSQWNDRFRLWFTDHALHNDVEKQEDETHSVSYLGVLHQALRDLSAWVEQGVAPPAGTVYQMVEGRVVLPSTAEERKGIQPVITLKANGGARAEVTVGEPVEFTAIIEVPPGTGCVVSAQWNYDGTGTFPLTGQFDETNSGKSCLTLTTIHTFTRPGTYFPVLRAASQRQGDWKTPYGQVYNLGRVRVVVH